jgi:glycosyltransferase involved in cell wall biosynthesis
VCLQKMAGNSGFTYFVAIWWLGVIGVLIAMYYLGVYDWYVNESIFSETWIAIVFFCSVIVVAELVYSFFYYIKQVPEISEEERNWNKIATKTRTVCIIPCHKAAEGLPEVLEILVQIFSPDKIWLADNANQATSPDNTKEVAEQFGCRYVYFPVGSKTNAMSRTLRIAYRNDPTLEYAMFMDDDTILSTDFVIRTDLFLNNERMAGYVPHMAIKKSDEWKFWEEGCDYEYRMITHHNSISGHYHSLKFLHGLVSVYRMDRALILYANNPCSQGGLWWGEDAWSGIQCRQNNWYLGKDDAQVAFTFSPTTLLFTGGREQGYGAASLWKQRCMRWYTSWMRRIAMEILMFLSFDAGTILGNFTYRLEMVYYFYLIASMTLWPYFLIKIAFFGSGDGWIDWLWLHLFLAITAISVAYLRNFNMPKVLRMGMKSVLTYPVLAAALTIMYAISFWVAVLWFIPYSRDYRKSQNPGYTEWIEPKFYEKQTFDSENSLEEKSVDSEGEPSRTETSVRPVQTHEVPV